MQSACDEASIIKDNSISLLEFMFDLNFDEIFFPENPNKIVQNKIKVFLEFNSIMEPLNLITTSSNI